MPESFFTTDSEVLKNLICQNITEVEGKRSKLKKAALCNLSQIQIKSTSAGLTLHKVLVFVGGVSEERASNIVTQVEESLKDGSKKGSGAVDKSKDFRSFLKQ